MARYLLIFFGVLASIGLVSPSLEARTSQDYMREMDDPSSNATSSSSTSANATSSSSTSPSTNGASSIATSSTASSPGGAASNAMSALALPKGFTLPWDNSKSSGDGTDCSTCEGKQALNRGDYARAIAIFRKNAAQNDGDAMNDIGFMYINGLGVKRDYSIGEQWLQKAVAAGYAPAKTNLRDLHMRTMANQSPDDLQKAAANGSIDAAYMLGLDYEHGSKTAVDYDKAMSWYVQASSKGDASAMNNIGYMYEHGEGVPANIPMAKFWYTKAIVDGNQDAKVHLQQLETTRH